MKRLLMILAVVLAAVDFAEAQKWQDYVQFGAGVGLSWGDDYGALLRAEYGKTWKWLDLSLSMTYESEMNSYNERSYIHVRQENNFYISNNGVNDVSVSLSFNAKMDMVRLFTEDSKHSFKIGGGIGCEHSMSQSASKDTPNGLDNWDIGHDSTIALLPILWVGYDYLIAKKTALGAFFYGGHYSPCIGLSLRRNF